MPRVTQGNFYAPNQEDWDRGVRIKVESDGSSSKTTKEIGETIGGFSESKKSTTPESAKGPKPVEPPVGASLGAKAAYSRALREWNAK